MPGIAGKELYVYSSGSVQAQKLLFGYTPYGDLTSLFSGYFDTRIGDKRAAASYERIRESISRPAGEFLFLSDIGEELDAALAAGMQTCWLMWDRMLYSHRAPSPGAGLRRDPNLGLLGERIPPVREAGGAAPWSTPASTCLRAGAIPLRKPLVQPGFDRAANLNGVFRDGPVMRRNGMDFHMPRVVPKERAVIPGSVNVAPRDRSTSVGTFTSAKGGNGRVTSISS